MRSIQGSLLSVDPDGEMEPRKHSLTMPSADEPDITATKTATQSSMISSGYAEDLTPLSQSEQWEEGETRRRSRRGKGQSGTTKKANLIMRTVTDQGQTIDEENLSKNQKSFNNGKTDTGKRYIMTNQSTQVHKIFSGTLSEDQPTYRTFNSTSAKRVVQQMEPAKRFKIKMTAHLILALFGFFLIGGGIWFVKNLDKVAQSSFVHNIFSSVKKENPSHEKHSSIADTMPRERVSSVPPVRGTASPETAPVAPQVKKIFIRTNPSGSQIWVNNEFIAQSPSVVSIPLSDSPTITIHKEGYISRTFQVRSPVPSRVNIALRKDTGRKVPAKNIRVIE